MLVMVEKLELLEAQVTQDPPGEMVVTLTQTTMGDQPEQAALGRGQRLVMLALVQIQATAVETVPRSLVREVRARTQFDSISNLNCKDCPHQRGMDCGECRVGARCCAQGSGAGHSGGNAERGNAPSTAREHRKMQMETSTTTAATTTTTTIIITIIMVNLLFKKKRDFSQTIHLLNYNFTKPLYRHFNFGEFIQVV